MKRKLIGNGISSFGLGITVSAIVHPLGYMESQSVFYTMLVIGAALLLIGNIIKDRTQKENGLTNSKIQ